MSEDRSISEVGLIVEEIIVENTNNSNSNGIDLVNEDVGKSIRSMASVGTLEEENKKKSKKYTGISKKEKQLAKLDILKKLSAGTGLREGLNDIVKGGMGALIVISNEHSSNVFQGGFKINAKFTSKRLMELAKMDGAIILSEDFKKILYANTLLTPNKNLLTNETGTRHQAAERVAKQTKGLVMAVSERRGTITIYYGNSRYVLQDTEELMRRTTETLQILDKQREVLDELITNMNLLEFNNLVSVADVCAILERLEMINKMAEIITEHIIELGKDGIIMRMRMREITTGLEKKYEFIVKDYLIRPNRARQYFDHLSFEGLLDLEEMAKNLFSKSIETGIVPKGYRILNKTSLSKGEIEGLIKHFKNLSAIINSDEEALRKIIKNNSKLLMKELSTLREHILVGKKI
jgi:diadenylate cyclase